MNSENISKKKRGRPKLIDDKLRATYNRAGLFTETRTERGKQNVHYWVEAMNLLRDIRTGDEFEYLISTDKKIHEGKERIRRTILTELGRITNPEDIQILATHICEEKPTTREAIAIIRNYRGVQRTKPTSQQLAEEIARQIDNYRTRHEVDDSLVHEALDTVLRISEGRPPMDEIR